MTYANIATPDACVESSPKNAHLPPHWRQVPKSIIQGLGCIWQLTPVSNRILEYSRYLGTRVLEYQVLEYCTTVETIVPRYYT